MDILEKVQKMVKVEITGGICGFTTQVYAEDKTGYKASFQLESQCPNWKKINEVLGGERTGHDDRII